MKASHFCMKPTLNIKLPEMLTHAVVSQENLAAKIIKIFNISVLQSGGLKRSRQQPA